MSDLLGTAEGVVTRWSFVADGGDFDASHLPGPNDLDAFDTYLDAVRGAGIASQANPGVRYLIVRSLVSPWRLDGSVVFSSWEGIDDDEA